MLAPRRRDAPRVQSINQNRCTVPGPVFYPVTLPAANGRQISQK
jgi:hypothetical protein